jgi:choice-of-anchor B domain-containing protein
MALIRNVAALTPALLACLALPASAGPTTPDEDDTKVVGRAMADGPDGDEGRSAFASQNMSLLAHLPLSAFPGGSDSGNDCWGYVSPSGREYAIMGLERGYGFVEVTDPSNPVIVDYVAGPRSLWHDVKVIGHYAYGVSEGGSGIQVMDLSDIDNGVVDLVRNKTQQGHTTTHNIVANTDSGFLYLVGANIQNGGLVAVSTADPEDPTIVGAWNNMYVHDAQVVTYTEGPYAGREIGYCLSGFSGGFSQTGLRVVDVTDKNNMYTIATVSWSGARYAHQGWLSEDRRYFYINDEIDEGNSVNVTTTRVFNVEDPANPRYEGWFTTGLPATDHNLYTHNGLIFQSNYRSGLRVFDYSQDPVSPTEVAWFDSYPSDDGVGYNGAWSNYPYLPSGTIILSDIESGLFILRLEGIDLNIVGPQSRLDPGVPTAVTVEIVESFSTYDDQTVALNHAVNGSPAAPIPMSPLGGGFFRAELPPAECFDSVDYYVSVITDAGTMATSDTVAAQVYDERVVAFVDNFDTDKGWTAGAPDDDAVRGQWTRMPPQQTQNGSGQIAQPGQVIDGTNCWVTDGRAGNGLGDYDVDNGKTTLLSPVFDLSGNTDPIVSYWRWYSNHTGANPYNDIFVVDVSNDGGSTWTNFETVGPDGPEVQGGWYHVERRIADVVAPTSAVRFRFVASDYDPQALVEAAVDLFSIFDLVCEDCAADFNGDGQVNTQDVLSFLNAWTAGDDSADFNGDGQINTQDVLSFLNAWTAGC